MSHPITKTIEDVAIGSIGVASLWWIEYLQEWAGLVAAVGGAILVIVRLAIAVRDWRNGKRG